MVDTHKYHLFLELKKYDIIMIRLRSPPFCADKIKCTSNRTLCKTTHEYHSLNFSCFLFCLHKEDKVGTQCGYEFSSLSPDSATLPVDMIVPHFLYPPRLCSFSGVIYYFLDLCC